MSLQQASSATHIRPHYLEALENDQLEALPSKVQAKGFLRLYASFLGLDIQTVLAAWEKKEPLVLENAPQELAEQPAEELALQQDLAEAEPAQEVLAELSAAAPTDLASDQPVSSSQRIFVEIGQELRQQRLLLGLKLEDVERHTHVRQHYLQALENGRLEELPSLVQGRGMLSNISRFLGMDSEALLLRFAEGVQSRRTERISALDSGGKARRRPAQVSTWRKLVTPDLLIGGAVVLGLLVLGIWSAARVSALRTQQLAMTTQPISDVMMISSTPVSFPQAVVTRQVTQTVSNPLEVAPIPTQVITLTLPLIEPAPLQVYIIARQRAWMRVIVDQKVVFEGRIVPGSAYPFSGKQRIELLTGNAAALQVLFNQDDLGTLGLTGQVRSLIFTTGGVVTPTPIFTATPTETRLPTMTLFPTPTQPTATITPFIP